MWPIYGPYVPADSANRFDDLLQMCDFIEANYLTEQVEAIKELSDHVTNLKRVGPGLGEYMYQKESLDD